MANHHHNHNSEDELPEVDEAGTPTDSFREQLSKSPDPSIDGLITLLGVPIAELEKLVVDRINSTGRLDYLTSVRKVGTYDNMTYFATQRSGGEIAREMEFLAKIEDPLFNYALFDKNTGKPVLTPSRVKDAAVAPGTELKGPDGRRRMQAASRSGRRRIPLYNSGFSIDIRAPTIRELSDVITRSRYITGQYESILGAPYYMFYDRVLQAEFVSLMMDLITYSTCPSWDEEGVLLSRIDHADYPAIFGHVASLMYPNGYPGFRHFCRRPVDAQWPNGCTHVEEINANILHMVRTRFGRLSPFQIAHMQKACIPKTPITVEEIEAYREGFGHTKEVRFQNYTFKFRAPSLSDHLEAAAEFNAELLEAVKDNNVDRINAYISPRRLMALSPYIESITTHDEITGAVEGVARERDMILWGCDLVTGQPNVYEELVIPLMDFISDIQLTYVCYPTFACPKCGYEPKTPKGFYAVDPIAMFFTMAWKTYLENM